MYLNIEILEILLPIFLIPIIGIVLIAISKPQSLFENVVQQLIPLLSLSAISIAFFWYSNIFDYTGSAKYLIYKGNYSDLLRVLGNFKISFIIEPIALSFSLLSTLLWFINSIYAKSYFFSLGIKDQRSFFIYLSMSMFCVYGVAFSGNLFTAFVFYELLTIVTIPLVGYKISQDAIANLKLYSFQLLATSLLFLLPAIFAMSRLKSVNIDHFSSHGIMGGIISSENNIKIATIAIFMIIHGCAKAALLPFNRWLPAAMVAPTPVSAFLHAVAVVKSGAIFLIKLIYYVMGSANVPATSAKNFILSGEYIVFVATVTIIYSSIKAVNSKELKAILAYSTITHLSYIVGVAGLSTKIALSYSMIHLIAHAVSKITLFFSVGAIYIKTRKKNLDEIVGIAYTMPITVFIFALHSLSMLGIPPTIGAVSKAGIIQSALRSHSIIFLFALLFSTLTSAIYYVRIIYYALRFRDGSRSGFSYEKIDEAPGPILLCMFFTSFLSIFAYFMQKKIFFILLT